MRTKALLPLGGVFDDLAVGATVISDRFPASEATTSGPIEGEDGATRESKLNQVVSWRLLRGLKFASLLCLIWSLTDVSAEASDRRKCGPSTEQFLTERLGIWQQRLKLGDWTISIVMSHPSDLKPNTLGNIRWFASEKYALIQVLEASDYHVGCHDMLNDMEFTIVHELLHLKLSSLTDSDASCKDEEFAVNNIATALLSLDRRK